MNRAHVACIAVFGCVIWLGTTHCHAGQAEDEAAIRKNDEAYVAAYNRHDAKAIAALWSPDAVYTETSTGQPAVGRDAIEKVFVRTLADSRDSRLEIDAKSIQFVSPDVAIENG